MFVTIIIEDDNYLCERLVFLLLLNILLIAKSLIVSECVKSYGENCKHHCSQNCVNQTCDRLTGKCLSWCHEGFYGEKCTQGEMLIVLKFNIHEYIFIYVFVHIYDFVVNVLVY